MWAVQGILGALYERQWTGVDRLVECSLLETAIGFSSWTSAQWLADHEEPTRQGSRHRHNAPYQRMKTKDGYLMVGAAGQSIWEGWMRGSFGASGMVRGPALCDQPTTDAEPRNTRSRDRGGAHHGNQRSLGGAGGSRRACGPVYDYRQMFADPRVRHRGLVQYASDPELGEVPHIRTPIKIGEDVRVRTVTPKLGQHNAE